MLDWDNVRVFLHVSRKGSIRAAAETMGINHATVSRRIARFELQLGVRLFEKLPSGYQITSAGEEIVSIAETMEQEAEAMERQIYGRDRSLSGSLRVTMPHVLATHLMMPELARFSEQYPGIALEIMTSNETLNLTKRQADIALRLCYGPPPEHLYGRKLVSVHRAVYASKIVVKNYARKNSLRWISKEDDGRVPAWAKDAKKKCKQQNLIVNDTAVQLAATRHGMGTCINFCFIGDIDPELDRCSPGHSYPYGDLWILTHGDIRRTARIQAFMKFAADAVLTKRDLFAGKMRN